MHLFPNDGFTGTNKEEEEGEKVKRKRGITCIPPTFLNSLLPSLTQKAEEEEEEEDINNEELGNDAIISSLYLIVFSLYRVFTSHGCRRGRCCLWSRAPPCTTARRGWTAELL